MAEMKTETVRKQATLRLMSVSHQIHGPEGEMKFMASFAGDEKVAKRLRRANQEGRFQEWNEGRSLTIKSRAAWNILSEAGLDRLKTIESGKAFNKEKDF